MMNRYRPAGPLTPLTVAAAVLLATGLAGCSRSQPEPVTLENAETMTNDSATVTDMSPSMGAGSDANMAAAVPPAAASNASADVGTDVSAAAPVDQQVMDDASATGMTSKATRDARPAADDSAATPVEPK